MSSVWTRAWEKTPKIDCGLCGYVRCACYARAAIAGDCPLDQCPLLSLPEFSNRKAEFQLLVARGAQGFPKPAPEMPKGGVLLTSPCKDRVDRVMAELRVYNGVREGELARFTVFDPVILCDMLEPLSSQFEVVKCSRDLGYARADTGETSITILQDGRVNMRRMNDLDHVKRLFAMIETAIMPSVICNCCGRDLLSILADGSKDFTYEHTVFSAGSSLSLNTSHLRVASNRGVFQSYGGDALREVVRLVDGTFVSLKSEVNTVVGKTATKAGSQPSTTSARSTLIGLAYDERMRGLESLAFKAHAILWLVDDALRALVQVERELQQRSGAELSELRKLLLSAAKGEMPDYVRDVVKPQVLTVYAHIRRVDRAMKAFNSWTTAQHTQ